MKNRILSTTFVEQNKKKIIDFYGKTTNSKFLIACIPILWMFLFFILPLIIALKISFSESAFSTPPYTDVFSWTKKYMLQIELNLSNYATLIKDAYYRCAFLNSLLISTAATFLCLVIGYMMAYAMNGLKERTRSILLLFISLSFWTSFLIRVYSWMNLLSVHGVVNSFLTKIGLIDTPIQFIGNYYSICLGMVFCYLPFMIFPIYSVLEKVDKSCIEAAYDLGCSPVKTFWVITVPLSKFGIITGCVLVFASSIGEFVVPELLGGADCVTVGRVLWTEFFSNLDWPMACALSVVMAIFIVLPIFFFQRKGIDHS